MSPPMVVGVSCCRDFVEPSKRGADIIVPEGGHATVAVDMRATKMAWIPAAT